MRPGDSPVLFFCRPAAPYVCLGYHRRLDELDLHACRADGLPVLRRAIGGGPVYLDADQLFFGVAVPQADAPAGVQRLYERFLGPAVTALRALGLDARLDGLNDIAVEERKVSGTGAGQIGGGVIVVGNVIFRFPHERMACVLAVPSEAMRAECLRLMRRHVSSLEREGRADVGAAEATGALRAAYAEALGLVAQDAAPTAAERSAIAVWARRLAHPDWVAGPVLPERDGRQVKVRDGVWVYSGRDGALEALASVAGGRIVAAHVRAPSLNGVAEAMARAIEGARAHPDALRGRLEGFGPDGRSVLRALEDGLVLR
jgi:lipoate-protein ligase A